MRSRRRNALRIIGFGLVGLALLSFAVRIAERVLTGHGLDTYHSGKLVSWNYGSAFVTLLFVTSIGAALGIAWLVRVWRHRSSFTRGLPNSPSSKHKLVSNDFPSPNKSLERTREG
jgi:hypothetical protein